MKFDRYLKQVEKKLAVPYPERKDLLAEIASHLEDLYEEKLRAGFSEQDARQNAMRTMAVDNSFYTDIDEVHAPLVRRALAILPPPLSMVIEHLGVGLVAVLVLITVIIKEEVMIRFFAEMGFFMYPLNLMGLAILFLAGERIFSLYIKKDHSKRNLNQRLLSFKFLGTASAIVGVIGTLLGYFHAFSSAERISAKFGGTFPIWEVSRIAISTTIWGLTLSLVAAIAWYVFRAKGARISEMHVQ